MENKFRYLAILVFCLATGSLCARELSVIRGEWASAPRTAINLYEISNGYLKEIASSKINAAGMFAFAFYPEKEGYYAVAVNERAAANRYVFYFKPGDNLQFRIEKDNWSLTGDNSQENKEMEKWHTLVQPLEAKSVYFMNNNSIFSDFFPQLESALPVIEVFPKAATGNEVFNRSFEYFKKYNLIEIALMFTNTPRSEHPKSSDYTKFYRDIRIPDLTRSATLLDYPEGIGLIENAYRNALRCEGFADGSKMKAIDKNLLDDPEMIANDTVKGELVLALISRRKTYSDMMDFKERYETYLVSDGQKQRLHEFVETYSANDKEKKQRLQELVEKLNSHSGKQAATDFKFPDRNGKTVALSDFKGKVVYIDVWATWCGPCHREIPDLAKLEEEYKNNENIVFMGVSIDAEKDRQKWKDMIREKNMKGVQLFAGGKSKNITEPYQIKSIPRFILVGKDGNLVMEDAIRPSSGEIRFLLDRVLRD